MKVAKLFKSGGSQAVRLPKEFRFKGSEVYVERDGVRLILIPKEKRP
jgi:antitoxin VapB